MPLSSMYPPFLINQVDKSEGGVLLVPDTFAVRVIEPTVARFIEEKVLLRSRDSARHVALPSAVEDKETIFETILRPNGDGDLIEIHGKDGYLEVDEVVADEDGSYIESSQSTFTSLAYTQQFTLEDPPSIVHPVLNVSLYVRSRETAGAGRLTMGFSLPGGSDGNLHDLTGAYTTYSATLSVSPATGLPWTWAEVGAMTADVTHTVQIPALESTVRTTQVWAVARHKALVSVARRCNAG